MRHARFGWIPASHHTTEEYYYYFFAISVFYDPITDSTNTESF